MDKLKIAFCVTGSFCTLKKLEKPLRVLVDAGADVQPVFSPSVYNTDTRFGKAEYFKNLFCEITGNEIWHTVVQAEPIGPKNHFDLAIVAPCTGNTLSKIAKGITDTSVTMAVKATMRNNKPVVLAISTNDGLSGNAQNLGVVLARKNVFFVPFGQDDAIGKPTSLVAHFDLIPDTISEALNGTQIQPILKA